MPETFHARPHALHAARQALVRTNPDAVPWTREEYRDRYRRACAAIMQDELARFFELKARQQFRALFTEANHA